MGSSMQFKLMIILLVNVIVSDEEQSSIRHFITLNVIEHWSLDSVIHVCSVLSSLLMDQYGCWTMNQLIIMIQHLSLHCLVCTTCLIIYQLKHIKYCLHLPSKQWLCRHHIIKKQMQKNQEIFTVFWRIVIFLFKYSIRTNETLRGLIRLTSFFQQHWTYWEIV